MFPDWLTDLHILEAPLPAALDAPTARGALWQAGPGCFQLNAPGTARYRAVQGRTFTIDRLTGANEGDVRRLACGTPLAALLYQRGWLALHAAALTAPASAPAQMAGRAVLLAGDSGAGKSTLAAALLQQGWQLLADDLAPLALNSAGQLMVYPLQPELLLWPISESTIAYTGPEPQVLANGKRAYALPGPFSSQPHPLAAIYWLATNNQPEVSARPVSRLNALKALPALLYNSRIADALCDRLTYLRLSTAIAQAVPICRITRPNNAISLDQLIAQVTGQL